MPQSPLADPTRQRDWMDKIVEGRQRKSHGKGDKPESVDSVQRADSSQHGMQAQGEDLEHGDRPHRADGSQHDSSKAGGECRTSDPGLSLGALRCMLHATPI